MNQWWWELIKRALVWTFLGALHGAAMGALCGAIVGGGMGVFEGGWGWGSIQRLSDVIVGSLFIGFWGAIVGVFVGSIPGAILYLILNFYCSPSYWLWHPPLRFVSWGMLLGSVLGSLSLALIWFAGSMFHIAAPSFFGSFGSHVLTAPICMVLGQIAGGIYTVLQQRKKQEGMHVESWLDLKRESVHSSSTE